MRQIGQLTRLGQMAHDGTLSSQFYTCPVCRTAMSRSPAAVYGHLGGHVKKGLIPKGYIGYIKLLLYNKRGCNVAIERLAPEVKFYVLDFVARIRGESYQRATPVHNYAHTKKY